MSQIKNQTTDKLLSAGRSLWGYFTTKESARGEGKVSPRRQGPEITTVAFDYAMSATKTAAQVTSKIASQTFKR